MLKKIIIVIFLLMSTVGVMKYLEYKRVLNIIIDIVGNDNYTYIEKMSESIVIAKGSFEGYVYKITNIDKINCTLLEKYSGSSNFLSNFSEQYIEKSKMFCHTSFSDKFDRLITITIQNNILILEIDIE